MKVICVDAGTIETEKGFHENNIAPVFEGKTYTTDGNISYEDDDVPLYHIVEVNRTKLTQRFIPLSEIEERQLEFVEKKKDVVKTIFSKNNYDLKHLIK